MSTDADEREMLEIIENYANLGPSGDADGFSNLFWPDDPNFAMVENDRPHPLGPEYVEMLTHLIRERGRLPNQRFYDTRVYFLTPEVAYSVSLRDELNSKKTSRVTFVYQRKQDEWRIIHGHFSYVPE